MNENNRKTMKKRQMMTAGDEQGDKIKHRGSVGLSDGDGDFLPRRSHYHCDRARQGKVDRERRGWWRSNDDPRNESTTSI